METKKIVLLAFVAVSFLTIAFVGGCSKSESGIVNAKEILNPSQLTAEELDACEFIKGLDLYLCPETA